MDVPPSTADLDLAGAASDADLLALLNTLHLRAGSPSYRTIEIRARKAGRALSKSRAGEIINGARFPNRDALIAFVQACGVPAEEVPVWALAWERCNQRGPEKPGGGTAHSETAIIAMRVQARSVLQVLALAGDITGDLTLAGLQSSELSHLRDRVLLQIDALRHDRSGFLRRAQALYDALAATRTHGMTADDTLWNALISYTAGERAAKDSQFWHDNRDELSNTFEAFLARLSDVAGDSGRALAQVLDHTLALASERADDLADALNRNDMTDETVAASFASHLVASLGAARATAQEVTSTGLELVDKRHDRLIADLGAARAYANTCSNALDAFPVDVSSGDLSDMDPLDLEMLAGVVWSPETIWPSGIAEQVSARSEEIRPGLYQVCRPTDVPDDDQPR